MCRALAILSGGRDVPTNLTEPVRARDRREGARDFVFHRPSTRIAFGLVGAKEHSVEFTPDKPGEYSFQCLVGMLRGKPIVE